MSTCVSQHEQNENVKPDGSSEPAAQKLSTIELGWIVAGRLDEADYEAVRMARAAVLNIVNEKFSEFSWRMPLIRRPEMVSGQREEPVMLLEQGVSERETHRLDFGILVTPVDLESHYKPFALAAISRALDLAAISTARIDPLADDANLTRDERVQVMADRLQALVLHALGHLCGLTHQTEPDNVMFDLQTIGDLAGMQEISAPQREQMGQNLRQIADLRLEEQATNQLQGTVPFYLRGAWLNRHEILDAVWQARPWEFPRRLSRLTTASLSAAMLLLMTAETWEMATSQTTTSVMSLAAISVLATTLFIIVRQQLLVHRHARRLTEQTVITNVSTFAIVLCGMLTTLLMLFTLSLLLAMSLFGPRLAGHWAASLEVAFDWTDYSRLSAVIASLAALIGALGASFEQQQYFRHITFVDEET